LLGKKGYVVVVVVVGPYGNKETGVSSMALFHWLKMHGGDSWMN
jgi:hypothetical protein